MKLKIKRTLGSFLPVSKNREGECNNCGACCHLPFRCTFLKTGKDGKGHCTIYKVRPPNCRKFPRTVEELDTVQDTCSFSFNEAHK